MASIHTTLSRLVKAAINSVNVAECGADLRAYMLQSAAEIEAFYDCAKGSVRLSLNCHTDEELPAATQKWLADVDHERRMRSAEKVAPARGQAAARLSASVERDGDRFYVDADAVFGLANAMRPTDAFLLETCGEDIEIGARRVQELARAVNGLPCVAYVERNTMVHAVNAKGGRRELTRETRLVEGWTLVVEWKRASGSRGMLRFHHDASQRFLVQRATVYAEQDQVAA